MKKILCLLFVVVCSCSFAVTKPSYFQLSDVPIHDVREFGAKGDGSTDDSDEINAALASGSIILSTGTYKCTSNINIPSNRRILGTPEAKIIFVDGVGFHNTADQQTSGTSPTLSGSNAAGAKDITTSGNTPVVGNWYFIGTSLPSGFANVYDWAVASYSAGYTEVFLQGDFIRAGGVSGGTITSDDRLSFTYAAASGHTIANWSHTKNISIESLNIECSGSGGGTSGFPIYFVNVMNGSVKNCELNCAGLKGGIWIQKCNQIQLQGNRILRNQQLAVHAIDCCANVSIVGNTVQGQTSSDGGIFISYGCNRVTVTGNSITGDSTASTVDTAGISLHLAANRNTVTGNTINSINTGIRNYLNAFNNVVSHNVISNCPNFGIFWNGYCRDDLIHGNVIVNCGNANGLSVSAQTAGITLTDGAIRTTVSENTIKDCPVGVFLNGGSYHDVRGNRFNTVPSPAYFNATKHCNFDHNTVISSSSTTPIQIRGEAKFNSFRFNTIENPGNTFGAFYDFGQGYANEYVGNWASGSQYLILFNAASATWPLVSVRDNVVQPAQAISNKDILCSAESIASITSGITDIPTGFRVYSVPSDRYSTGAGYDFHEKTASGTGWIRRELASEGVVIFP